MAFERLHIIIPSSKPHFIGLVARHYLDGMEQHPFEVRIHVLYQGREPDPKGMHKTDEGIDSIQNGWLFMMADDTLQHPALLRRLGEIIEANPSLGAVVFDTLREWNSGHRVVNQVMDHELHCHGGHIAWRRDWLGNERYGPNFEGWGDVMLARRKLPSEPDKVHFCHEFLTTLNSLQSDDRYGEWIDPNKTGHRYILQIKILGAWRDAFAYPIHTEVGKIHCYLNRLKMMHQWADVRLITRTDVEMIGAEELNANHSNY